MTSLLSAIRAPSSSTLIKNFCPKSGSNQLMDQTSRNVNQLIKSYLQRNYSAKSRNFSANIVENHKTFEKRKFKSPKISHSKEKEPLTFEDYKQNHLMTYEEYKKSLVECYDRNLKPAIFYEESTIQEGYQYYCNSAYNRYLEILDPSKRCNPRIL